MHNIPSFDIGLFRGGKKFLPFILLIAIQIHAIAAEFSCYKCEGADCDHGVHREVEKCSNGKEVCATVFNGDKIEAQGCLENIPKTLRKQCDGSPIDILNKCHKCKSDLCNLWALSDSECVQCDSKNEDKCTLQDEPILIHPTKCYMGRTPNLMCYALKEDDRVIRGCAGTIEEQRTCHNSDGCYFCNPNITPACNMIIPVFEDSHKPKPNSAANVNELRAGSFIIMAMTLLFKYFL
ncbi:uncharacterized protein LOC142238430 [Haematobia irritans]|uniref:Putative cell wall protein iff6 n=1 Tax=Haematobia irritans TaxID=7368 RepID=A0A1L8EAK9_HAEIR